MKKYKIGQVLTSNHDIVIEHLLSGEKEIVPKGSKIIIGADNMAHHLRDGSIQPLADDAVVQGYDTHGIAAWLYRFLNSRYELDYMLETYDCTKFDFVETVVEALEEIGFYE